MEGKRGGQKRETDQKDYLRDKSGFCNHGLVDLWQLPCKTLSIVQTKKSNQIALPLKETQLGLCGPILWASCICGLSHFFAILWTVVHQAPLCMGFSRQEYWSGLPCPLPGDLPDLGVEPVSVTSPASANGFFTTSTTWEVHCGLHIQVFKYICVCVCI